MLCTCVFWAPESSFAFWAAPLAIQILSTWCSWPIPPPLAYPTDIRARRCSILVRPLLAHLTADYTPATDPAAAQLPPAYCLLSRTPPPLDHLHC
ncbi:hypothetical protein B0H14DRAFT_1154969 [Mycena olivaceomarginata]|nr:hypothetical protein B0H14DRAFT_1154969 [Mycena olivaceomarginata]